MLRGTNPKYDWVPARRLASVAETALVIVLLYSQGETIAIKPPGTLCSKRCNEPMILFLAVAGTAASAGHSLYPAKRTRFVSTAAGSLPIRSMPCRSSKMKTGDLSWTGNLPAISTRVCPAKLHASPDLLWDRRGKLSWPDSQDSGTARRPSTLRIGPATIAAHTWSGVIRQN